MKSCFFWKDPYLEILLPSILQKGGLVLGHSDTVFGLLAELSSEGVNSLNRVKGRQNKPYIILVENKQKALALIEKPITESLQKLIDACWPGPLTLVCKARSDFPDGISVDKRGKKGAGTIAVRVPDHAGLLSVLSHVDGLFSTSANKAGFPVPSCLEEVDPSLLESIDCIVLNQDQDGLNKSILASTILDCTQDSIIKVIREGAYPISLIEQKTGLKII